MWDYKKPGHYEVMSYGHYKALTTLPCCIPVVVRKWPQNENCVSVPDLRYHRGPYQVPFEVFHLLT